MIDADKQNQPVSDFDALAAVNTTAEAERDRQSRS